MNTNPITTLVQLNSYGVFDMDNLKNVYFEGSNEQWTKINISSGNEDLTNARFFYNYKYCSDNAKVRYENKNSFNSL